MADRIASFLIWLILVIEVTSWRLEPTEPFAPPSLIKDEPSLSNVFGELKSTVQKAAKRESSPWKTNITSFSIAVTSASETLWTSSYTAPVLGNYVDSSPSDVTEHTYFRIASISKVFTVFAALVEQQAKNWSLQDPITKYVPELLEGANADTVDWGTITLETLASQLSGIPRECQHVCPTIARFSLTWQSRRSK
ncbi:MAG: hypothetical protein Q9225_004490 [Loekoesia sp. 1 TL-2023]